MHEGAKHKKISERVSVRMLKRREYRAPIPKGLYHSAQRCRDNGAATLGDESQYGINPERVESMWRAMGCNPFRVGEIIGE
jgi:hypothetical protein